MKGKFWIWQRSSKILSCLEEDLPEMTLAELTKFDGEKDPKLYLGCKNMIFDVTNSGIVSIKILLNHRKVKYFRKIIINTWKFLKNPKNTNKLRKNCDNMIFVSLILV